MFLAVLLLNFQKYVALLQTRNSAENIKSKNINEGITSHRDTGAGHHPRSTQPKTPRVGRHFYQ